MQNFFNSLRSCPLFYEISDEDIFSVLHCFQAKHYKFNKNDIILFEGEKAKNIGIVLSGSAQMYRIDYYGNKSILSVLSPSELFGESYVCAETNEIPITVEALSDTDILFIDCKHISSPCQNLCSFHNQLIFNLMKILANKNIQFNQKLEIVSKRTTREKLMTYLTQQSKKINSNRITVPFDRQALADFLEVDRSGLSAEISKLRNEGIIECKKNKFKLLSQLI